MHEFPFSLKNKRILVTGASSGIGRSIAIEASKAGAIIEITGRNEERLSETFEMLDKSYGQEHRFFVLDLILNFGNFKN